GQHRADERAQLFVTGFGVHGGQATARSQAGNAWIFSCSAASSLSVRSIIAARSAVKSSNRNERLCRANALCGRIAASSVAPIVGLSALPASLRCARLSRPHDERHYGSNSNRAGSRAGSV